MQKPACVLVVFDALCKIFIFIIWSYLVASQGLTMYFFWLYAKDCSLLMTIYFPDRSSKA